MPSLAATRQASRLEAVDAELKEANRRGEASAQTNRDQAALLESERFGHDKLQNSVAEKFQPLVMGQAVTRILVQVRAVDEGLFQEILVVENDTDLGFEFGEIHNSGSMKQESRIMGYHHDSCFLIHDSVASLLVIFDLASGPCSLLPSPRLGGCSLPGSPSSR